jgi:two-component system sensor histidine kinase ArlS
MLKNIKEKFILLPMNKRVALLLSIGIFIITILLTFSLQLILKESEMSILNSIKDQFPNYVAAREDVLNAFMGDRLSRYLSYLPLFAIIDLVINYYFISYVINRFYGPLAELIDQIKKNGNALNKKIKIDKNNNPEYVLLEDDYNNLINKVSHSEIDLEEFIQNATHEIKTPLFAIKTSADVLNLKSKPMVSEYKSFESIVELLTNRLIRIVDSLIILTKDKLEFVKKDRINLSETLERTIRLLKNKADAIEVTIQTDIEKDIYYEAQQRFIDTIFINILDNAIKYSKHNKKIVVSLNRIADKIIFKCVDSGIGIPESEIQHIKEKFYRASNIIDEGIEGSGLGLSVVDKIINEYGGKFEIKSMINQGTEVTIEF